MHSLEAPSTWSRDQLGERSQDRNSSALPAPRNGCDSIAGPSQRHDHGGEVLSVGEDLIFAFASGADRTAVPRLHRSGIWYALTYHLGDTRSGMTICDALEISRSSRGGASTLADISLHVSITCLVHERWLAEFAKSIGPDLSPRADALRDGIYYLPAELRAIATHALIYDLTGPARQSYRAAKGIELLCETARLSMTGGLISSHARSGLSVTDIQRLTSAKKMIAEQFDKKLTLNSIGHVCGLNRAKLTRGFKILFGTSIGEALSEARLWSACALIQTTNKPISSIGYEAGYLNNASFTRAFRRRYGVCPSAYRTNSRRSLCGSSDRGAHLADRAA